MKNFVTVGIVAGGLVLMGCEGMGPKQTAGTVIGGAGGALIGSTIGGGSGRIVATGVGAVLGSLLGSSIGAQLDQRDQLLAQRTATRTLERSRDGATASWRNPNTGRYGRSTVSNTAKSGATPCRTLSTVTYDNSGNIIASENQRYCRNSAGQWYPF